MAVTDYSGNCDLRNVDLTYSLRDNREDCMNLAETVKRSKVEKKGKRRAGKGRKGKGRAGKSRTGEEKKEKVEEKRKGKGSKKKKKATEVPAENLPAYIPLLDICMPEMDPLSLSGV
jgi:hypothetical protein